MAIVENKKIYVLIACEESQVECQAFRDQGCVAYSCDVKPCRRGANPSWHIQGDVTPLLEGCTQFTTMDGENRWVPKWDLIVAHPPCTFLCKVGSVQLIKGGKVDPKRYAEMMKAREFFFRCLNAKADYVAVENPLPMKRAGLPKPSCFIQPYWYGHKYSKKTLYWLRNLPPLLPDASNPEYKEFVRSSRGKYRSRTFEGVARAMARQWIEWMLRDFDDMPG